MKALRRNDVTVIYPTALVAECSAVNEPPPPVEDVEKVFPFLRRNYVTVIYPNALVAECSAVEPPPPVEDVEKVFPFLTLTSSSSLSLIFYLL